MDHNEVDLREVRQGFHHPNVQISTLLLFILSLQLYFSVQFCLNYDLVEALFNDHVMKIIHASFWLVFFQAEIKANLQKRRGHGILSVLQPKFIGVLGKSLDVAARWSGDVVSN